MDVSPKTLREVEFREKMRGYHPEDVDQFLERVAAGIEVLQDRLRQAIERAQRAEQAATEAGGNDDSLRRTLLLAQRTADLAVQEGREQAARIVSSAEQQAQQLITDADQQVRGMVAEAERRAQSTLSESEQRSQAMLSEAEERARRGHEDTLVEVRAELAKLEVTRQRLQLDVDNLTRWVTDHRTQLRAALEDAVARIDQLDMSPPAASGAPYPFAAPGGNTSGSGFVQGPAPVRPAAPNPSPAAEAPLPPRSPTPDAPRGVQPSPPSRGPGGQTGPSGQPGPSGPSAPPAQSPQAAPHLPSGPQGQPARPGPTASAWAPPPSQGVLVGSPTSAGPWSHTGDDDGDDETSDGDPYFAELRRAISDGDPLGPRGDGAPGTGA